MRQFNSIFKSSKTLFHIRESATESLSCRKASTHFMLEFITESGMIKNIYFTVLSIWRKRLLRTAKSMWQFNSMFTSSITFFPSTWDCNREFYFEGKRLVTRCENSSQNLGWSKTSTSHSCQSEGKDYWELKSQCGSSIACLHRLKHLIHRRETPKRVFNEQENVYSIDVRIHHRIWDDQKHLLHILVKPKKRTIENWKINLAAQWHLFII